MQWFFKTVLGAILQAVAAAMIAAVCLIWGFVPAEWIAREIGQPPAWVVNPVTRLSVLIVGLILIVLLVVARNRLVDPLQWERRKLVDRAFVTLAPDALAWIMSSYASGRAPNDIGAALSDAGLIDRDFVGWTEIKPELKALIAHKAHARALRLRLQTAATGMEPSHLIIAGLVIALIGAGWQIYRDRTRPASTGASSSQQVTITTTKIPAVPPEIAAKIAALEAELAETKNKLAATPPTVPSIPRANSAATAPSPLVVIPTYSNSESEQLTALISSLSGILNKRLEPIRSAETQYLQGMEMGNQPNAKDIISKIHEFEDGTEKIFNDIYREIIPQNKYFAEEIKYILAGDEIAKNPLYRLSQANLGYIGNLHMVNILADKMPNDKTTENQLIGLTERDRRDVVQNLGELGAWITGCNARIDERRHGRR